MFALSLSDSLNKRLYLNITDKAFPNKPLVSDPESDTSAIASNANTYERKEIESMLGYIDEDIVIHTV